MDDPDDATEQPARFPFDAIYAAFHPWGYFPLDFVAHRDRPHVPGDIVSLMVGIEFARERADLVAPLWETVRRLTDDELRTTVASPPTCAPTSTLGTDARRSDDGAGNRRYGEEPPNAA